MIDVATETLVPLTRVPDIVPSTRPGRKLHLATVWRWTQKGRLETVRIGGSRYTSREALARFAEHHGGPAPTKKETSKARRRAHERAEKELDAMGVK